MTAETAILNVLPAIAIDASSVNLGDGSYQSRMLLNLLNATGRDVAGRGEWSRLFRTFDAAGDTDLPVDFGRLTESGAVWAGTVPVRVVVAPEQWAFLSRVPSAQPYCHISNGRIAFSGLTGPATVSYVSKFWVDGEHDLITQNGDGFVFPDRVMETGVVYRWRRQNGLPFDDQIAEHEAEIDAALRADRGLK